MATTFDLLWKEFTSKHNISKDMHDKWKNNITSWYKDRYCNDMDALNQKLQVFESCRSSLDNPLVVFVALVFQLICYDIKSTDNAANSDEKFHEFATESGLDNKDAAFVEKVSQLIQLSASNSTDEHAIEGVCGTEDKHYFVDINFAIYGADAATYAQFTKKTRQEYHFLDDAAYKSLRLKVLQSFLTIPNVYATKEFVKKYEATARKNIQEEIDSLKS